jgi:hypothetical protein
MIDDNDKLDDLIRNAAQGYNRPPADVPRDAMWSAIESSRSSRALRPIRIVPATHGRSFTRSAWLGAAAAAVLLVATGVGIGRWSTLHLPAAQSSSKAGTIAPVASNDGQPKPSVNPAVKVENPVTPSAGEIASRSHGVGDARSNSGKGREVAVGRSTSIQTPSGEASTRNGSAIVPLPGARPEVTYQVATIRHLANAEALLTAFRTDSRDAKMDAQLASWARDLLSNTRLLLDSPAADDPQRARLLTDLELVLVQIVQLSPGANAQDRGLIEGSIRDAQVMTRLRSAIPAGPTKGI